MISCVALAMAGLAAGVANAQTFPSKTVRVLVGFSAGGGVDLMARIVSPRLAELMGQQFVVDNRPGANGMIAAELTAKSPPDGHTLLLAPGNYAFAQAMGQSSLDMTSAFTAVAQLVDSPLLVVVHPSLPVKNLAALVSLGRSRPGQLTYGSGGAGGAGHLATELFKSLARVDFLHVPYKGVGPALNDLVAGHVSTCFCTLPPTLPHAKSGRLRALAVTTAKRTAAAPEIPTVAEAGVAGYEMSQWYGVIAPAGTPAAVLDRLSAEINRAITTPDVRAKVLATGADPVVSSPAAFSAFFKAEVAKWTRIVKTAGVKAE